MPEVFDASQTARRSARSVEVLRRLSMSFAVTTLPASLNSKLLRTEFWAVSASMRAAVSCGFVIGDSAAMRRRRSSWRMVRSLRLRRCRRSSLVSLIRAGLPTKAAWALPATSEAASCAGVTSVDAFHCASLET
jgi:hypothetical protein